MSDSVKSWCDACQVAFERTGYGCDGHFECTKPNVPDGFRLTGDKELTDAGWREDIEHVANTPMIYVFAATAATCNSDPAPRVIAHSTVETSRGARHALKLAVLDLEERGDLRGQAGLSVDCVDVRAT